MACAAGKES
ncbi:hypothetical protein VCHC21A1_2725, partial [Vibrio cholerae HC-21A1]